ncbi:MAG TPA: NUDIX hydrolase [Candidatus Saccharimonadales bacterium]|nr:NUDIX hydrolase [Candidatus Saccharimonadales bacterium]
MARIIPENAILIPEHAKEVFKGVIFDVYQWQQQLFDGTTATFEMLKRPDTVIALCVKEGRIVFIREQQPGRPEYTRLPGGRVDPGEDWETAIVRECKEEIGLQFENHRLIHAYQPISKIEWFVAIYLMTDCSAETIPALDAGEKIEIVPMTFDEAKEHIAQTSDPLNTYTRVVLETASTIDDLLSLPVFRGKVAQ